MFQLVYAALFGWVAVTFALFSSLNSRRGIVASMVGGFLLLPAISITLADGLPSIDRATIISLSCLAAAMAFDPGFFARFRFHWLDLLPVIGCAAWGATNLTNGTGVQQCLLDIWWYVMFVGLPYFLARCCLNTPEGLRILAVGIVAGTIMMLPFVLYEARMSPELNRKIFGFSIGNATERFRLGGWRPRVFQPAGLGLAIWLGSAAVVAWALLLGNLRGRIFRVPIKAIAWVCLGLGLLSRGAGAIALMAAGISTLIGARVFGWKRLAFAIPIGCAVYIGTAMLDSNLPVRPILSSVGGAIFGDARQASLDTRFRYEAVIVNRALQKPMLGWGGWGDYRDVGYKTLTDGFWVIVIGKRGLIGLLSTYGWFLLPGAIALHQAIRLRANTPLFMLVLGLALFTWLYAVDLLFNGFATPIQALVAGALTSFAATASRIRDHSRSSTRTDMPKRPSSMPAYSEAPAGLSPESEAAAAR